MKKLNLIWGLGIFILSLAAVLVVAGSLNKSEESYAVKAAKEKATLATVERDQSLATFWSIFWPGVFTLAIGLVVWLIVSEVRHRRRLNEVVTIAKVNTLLPSPTGDYPARIVGNTLLSLAPGNGLPAPVPTHLTYSPHTIYRSDSRGLAPDPAVGLLDSGEEEAIPMPPTHVDLEISLRKYNLRADRLEVLMGETARGPVIRPFGPDTLHFGTLGRTGSGKTAFTQSVLTTLALHDPPARMVQFGFIDPKRKIYKPFSNLNHVQFVATDDTQAIKYLGETMRELKTRMDLTRSELLTQPFKIIVIDEFLSLRRQLDKSGWNLLVSLLEQGREARVYFIFMGHAFYSDKDMRELRAQLTTRSLFAVEDLGTAAAFGFRETGPVERLCNERKPGLYLMKSATGQELVQAPFIDEESIPRLLGAGNSVEIGGKSGGNSGNYPGNLVNRGGNFGNSVEILETFPTASSSNFQNLPFSTDEIDAFRLIIEGGEISKTETVKMMPGYSGREHKKFAAYYDIIQKSMI
jgi:hypothetical protein